MLVACVEPRVNFTKGPQKKSAVHTGQLNGNAHNLFDAVCYDGNLIIVVI